MERETFPEGRFQAKGIKTASGKVAVNGSSQETFPEARSQAKGIKTASGKVAVNDDSQETFPEARFQTKIPSPYPPCPPGRAPRRE